MSLTRGQTIQYAVVQYVFEGGEVPVIIPPHGNVKIQPPTGVHKRVR